MQEYAIWTAEQRARHQVSRPKERRGYPSDISDKEWKLVEPLLPGVARTGRPRKTELREVINALPYLVRSGQVVLFVHGATYPAETAFDLDLPNGGSWMNHVAERGHDAYLVDVRGYGKSSRPPAMRAAPDQHPAFATTQEAVQDVSAAIDFILKRRKVKKLNLVGWSWGNQHHGQLHCAE